MSVSDNLKLYSICLLFRTRHQGTARRHRGRPRRRWQDQLEKINKFKYLLQSLMYIYTGGR